MRASDDRGTVLLFFVSRSTVFSEINYTDTISSSFPKYVAARGDASIAYRLNNGCRFTFAIRLSEKTFARWNGSPARIQDGGATPKRDFVFARRISLCDEQNKKFKLPEVLLLRPTHPVPTTTFYLVTSPPMYRMIQNVPPVRLRFAASTIVFVRFRYKL